jgi:hypothetical protein
MTRPRCRRSVTGSGPDDRRVHPAVAAPAAAAVHHLLHVVQDEGGGVIGVLANLAVASFGHPSPGHPARPEEDPVPARPHRRLPRRNRAGPGTR